MSELSHLVAIYPVQHGLRNEDPEREREGTLHKWRCLHFLVGPLGLSRGEGNTEHAEYKVLLTLTWTWETQSAGMRGMAAR